MYLFDTAFHSYNHGSVQLINQNLQVLSRTCGFRHLAADHKAELVWEGEHKVDCRKLQQVTLYGFNYINYITKSARP